MLWLVFHVGVQNAVTDDCQIVVSLMSLIFSFSCVVAFLGSHGCRLFCCIVEKYVFVLSLKLECLMCALKNGAS